MGSLGDVGMGAWCSLSVSVFSGEEEARTQVQGCLLPCFRGTCRREEPPCSLLIPEATPPPNNRIVKLQPLPDPDALLGPLVSWYYSSLWRDPDHDLLCCLPG